MAGRYYSARLRAQQVILPSDRLNSIYTGSRDPSPYRIARDQSPYRIAGDPSPYRIARDPSPYRTARDPSPISSPYIPYRYQSPSPYRDSSPYLMARDHSPSLSSYNPYRDHTSNKLTLREEQSPYRSCRDLRRGRSASAHLRSTSERLRSISENLRSSSEQLRSPSEQLRSTSAHLRPMETPIWSPSPIPFTRRWGRGEADPSILARYTRASSEVRQHSQAWPPPPLPPQVSLASGLRCLGCTSVNSHSLQSLRSELIIDIKR